MFILVPQPKFSRKLKRLLRKNQALEKSVQATLETVQKVIFVSLVPRSYSLLLGKVTFEKRQK